VTNVAITEAMPPTSSVLGPKWQAAAGPSVIAQLIAAAPLLAGRGDAPSVPTHKHRLMVLRLCQSLDTAAVGQDERPAILWV
jgi:hypothetical protein